MSLELLELGLNFMGGIMGRSSANKDRRLQQQQMAQAQRQFDAQMDQSVTRRVRDAKNAGVHPLFALGASVGASPTISSNDPQSTGNPMGSALQAMASTLNSLETNRAQAARDNAEAALLDSERKRLEQTLSSGAQGSDSEALRVVEKGVKTYPYPGDAGYHGPATYYSPEIPMSQRPGVQAGTYPTRIQVTDEAGNTYTLPSPDLGMDEIGQIEYVMGVPGRMWKNISGNLSKQRDIRNMEKELDRLRTLRENPEKVAEAKALARRIDAKIASWYKKARRYFQ